MKVCFSKVLDVFNGKNQSKVINENGKYPIYGSGGIIGYANEYLCPVNTVIIGRKGNINKPIFVEEPLWNVDTAFGLVAKQEILLPKYLYYFCCKFDFDRLNTTVTIPSLTKSNLLNILIDVPTLQKQQRRVEDLDKIIKVIEFRRKQLQLLDTLVNARFVEMFGDPLRNDRRWLEASIKEVCENIYGGGTPSKACQEYYKGSIPWITPKDMKRDIISDGIDHITDEAVKNSAVKIVPKMSVLMVVRSGILKHHLPVSINTVPVTLNQDMKAFIPKKIMSAYFLRDYFKLIEKDVLFGVRSVTADNIDFKMFQNRKIILPPITLQKKYEYLCKKIDKSKVS